MPETTTGASVDQLAIKLGALETIYESYLAWVGVTLGFLTLAVILFGLVSVAYFRAIARGEAEKAAKQIAEDVAERRVNEYIQDQLPAMFEDYRDFLRKATDNDEADEIGIKSDVDRAR